MDTRKRQGEAVGLRATSGQWARVGKQRKYGEGGKRRNKRKLRSSDCDRRRSSGQINVKLEGARGLIQCDALAGVAQWGSSVTGRALQR